MQSFFRLLKQKIPKPILFGLYGAIGCFLAAILLGEMLLAFTKLPASHQPLPQAIVLLIDCSGSMNYNGKLQEVKSAAQKFVQQQDLTKNQIAVVGFGSQAHPAANLTGDKTSLKNAIIGLSDDGGTSMDQGITAAAEYLKSTAFNRNILLFTDGLPDSQFTTKNVAELVRIQGINIIAVATGDADTGYLAQVTGDPSLVIYANSGQFQQAFQKAEKIIGSLVESGLTGDYNPVYLMLRIGAWTGILGLGTSVALIIGQNAYWRRRLLTFKEGSISVGGGLVAGLTAGSIGQLLYLPETTIPIFLGVQIIQNTVSWVIVGLLLGGTITFFSGNFQLRSILLRGGLGGIFSGVTFWLATAAFGDIVGLLLGTAILSFCLRTLSPKRSGIATVGIFIVSLIAVIASQFLFLQLPGITLAEIIRRIAGWTILGALLGGGMSNFVPNLKLQQALLGGSIGGVIGAVGFVLATAIFGELTGRLLGAAILGFFIGLMIAWIEELSREASLIVHWTPTEKTTFSLGKNPVILGSSEEASIYLRKDQGFPPETARIYMEGEKIIMEYHELMKERGMKLLKQELNNNDKRKLGNIILEISIDG